MTRLMEVRASTVEVEASLRSGGARHLGKSLILTRKMEFRPAHPHPFTVAEAEQLDVSTIVGGELIRGRGRSITLASPPRNSS